MLYILKIGEKVNYFVAINFSEHSKSTREKQNFRKVAKLLYIFLTTDNNSGG